MSLIALAGLLLAQDDQRLSAEAELSLSKQRASFGQRKDAPPEWRYQSSEGVEPTIFLFPARRADVRYHFGQLPPAPSGKWFLSCQTKDAKGIHIRWSVDVDRNDNPNRRRPVKVYRGTLVNFLAWHGFGLASDVNGEVGKALSDEVCYAAYQFDSRAETLSYWFVYPDGERNAAAYSRISPRLDIFNPLFLYPISDVEGSKVGREYLLESVAVVDFGEADATSAIRECFKEAHIPASFDLQGDKYVVNVRQLDKKKAVNGLRKLKASRPKLKIEVHDWN